MFMGRGDKNRKAPKKAQSRMRTEYTIEFILRFAANRVANFGGGGMTKAIGIVEMLAALALFLGMALLDGCSRTRQPSPQIIVAEMRIPTSGSGSEGLEAVMVRPSDALRHPLALLTHGTPREASARADVTALAMIPQAREFARRGWTAVIVTRQGFGGSGGFYNEEDNFCGSSQFLRSAQAAAGQLRESAAYLATRPEVDPSRIIGVGVSTGGLAMVALATDPPPGMAAVINFAGGRASDGPDHVCGADSLVATFGNLGGQSKVPMLWIYAMNDHFFGPELAEKLYEAFIGNGGNVTFVAAPPFGEDGHALFSLKGIPEWRPMVDNFLSAQNLVLRDTQLAASLPAVEPPSYLSREARAEFQMYLAAAPHKVFAVSRSGQFGYVYGQRTVDEARQHAVENCTKYNPSLPCTPLMIDDDKLEN
jgi:dienelactone hydrolase